MSDLLSQVQEDVAALQTSVTELSAELSASQQPTVADDVLAAVTNVLVAAGWTAHAELPSGEVATEN